MFIYIQLLLRDLPHVYSFLVLVRELTQCLLVMFIVMVLPMI